MTWLLRLTWLWGLIAVAACSAAPEGATPQRQQAAQPAASSATPEPSATEMPEVAAPTSTPDPTPIPTPTRVPLLTEVPLPGANEWPPEFKHESVSSGASNDEFGWIVAGSGRNAERDPYPIVWGPDDALDSRWTSEPLPLNDSEAGLAYSVVTTTDFGRVIVGTVRTDETWRAAVWRQLTTDGTWALSMMPEPELGPDADSWAIGTLETNAGLITRYVEDHPDQGRTETLLRSRDGEVWEPINIEGWDAAVDRVADGRFSAERIVLVGWPKDGQLPIWTSDDDGISFQAIAESPDTAVDDDDELRSLDLFFFNDQWLLRFTRHPQPTIEESKSAQVVLLVSEDGSAWRQEATSDQPNAVSHLFEDSATLVAINHVDRFSRPEIWRSSEGRSWRLDEGAVDEIVAATSGGSGSQVVSASTDDDAIMLIREGKPPLLFHDDSWIAVSGIPSPPATIESRVRWIRWTGEEFLIELQANEDEIAERFGSVDGDVWQQRAGLPAATTGAGPVHGPDLRVEHVKQGGSSRGFVMRSGEDEIVVETDWLFEDSSERSVFNHQLGVSGTTMVAAGDVWDPATSPLRFESFITFYDSNRPDFIDRTISTDVRWRAAAVCPDHNADGAVGIVRTPVPPFDAQNHTRVEKWTPGRLLARSDGKAHTGASINGCLRSSSGRAITYGRTCTDENAGDEDPTCRPHLAISQDLVDWQPHPQADALAARVEQVSSAVEIGSAVLVAAPGPEDPKRDELWLVTDTAVVSVPLIDVPADWDFRVHELSSSPQTVIVVASDRMYRIDAQALVDLAAAG